VTMLERNAKKIYQEQHGCGSGEEVVTKYLPLIKKLAGKLSIALPPSLDVEDLVGSGIIGLLEALDRFEPSRGVQFSTYATWRIKGAMIDEIRKTSPAPRSFFGQFRQVYQTEEALRQSLSREPEREEIAAALGWTVTMVEQVWANYNLMTVVSLEKMIMSSDGDESLTLEGVIATPDLTPEELLTDKEQVELLAAAIDKLPSREKLLLSLFYYEELTKKEIAELMKVSAARISQLHSRAIERLRLTLTELAD
jgi:RNA polymerase sigma factor FliA